MSLQLLGSAPALAPAPLSTASSSTNNACQSRPAPLMTSKEWVIPPRPKPGRKPATDSPGNKRKAQNRAAQRAFRERRAAKVGQLEGSIKEIGKEYERSQEDMKVQIERLELQVHHFQSQVLAWQQRYAMASHELAAEKQRREAVENDLDRLKASTSLKTSQAKVESTKTASLLGDQGGAELMGCGNCTISSRCECVERALEPDPAAESQAVHAVPHKSSHSPPGLETAQGHPLHAGGEMEIDFTELYAKKNNAPQSTGLSTSPVPESDRCGFCEDGTACVCSMGQDESDAGRQRPQDTLQPPAFTTRKEACNPGTCAQCQADPNSTLFCKSLAAMKSAPSASLLEATLVPSQPPPTRQPTLSCADAFTTLSRHPHYAEASAELGSWLPALRTQPATAALVGPESGRGSEFDECASQEHRRDTTGCGDEPGEIRGDAGETPNRAPTAAMEVEAASVLGVLKLFDRRFGVESGEAATSKRRRRRR